MTNTEDTIVYRISIGTTLAMIAYPWPGPSQNNHHPQNGAIKNNYHY